MLKHTKASHPHKQSNFASLSSKRNTIQILSGPEGSPQAALPAPPPPTTNESSDAFFLDSISHAQPNKQLQPSDFNQYMLNASAHYNDDDDEHNPSPPPNLNDYEDYDLDEIDTGGELIFSDHADLYANNYEDAEEEEEEEEDEDESLDASQRCSSKISITKHLNDYDIFKLTKKNYKITFDHPLYPVSSSNLIHSAEMAESTGGPHRSSSNHVPNDASEISSQNHNTNNNESDSFASSVLLQQSSNYDENNLTNEFVDYEDEGGQQQCERELNDAASPVNQDEAYGESELSRHQQQQLLENNRAFLNGNLFF